MNGLSRRVARSALAVGVFGSALCAAPAALAQVPAPDRPPTVKFSQPVAGPGLPTPRLPAETPTTVTADAGDDRGVANVTFLAGTRVLCTVTAAPFQCAFQPQAQDVGVTTLIARATDTGGATSTDIRDVQVNSFRPLGITMRVRPRRDRKAPYRFRAGGALQLPPGLNPQSVCFGGSVQVTAKSGRRQENETALISRNCTYRLSILTERSRRQYLTAEFRGNRYLESVTSKRVRVRAG